MRASIIIFFLFLIFKNIYGSFDNDIEFFDKDIDVEAGLGDLSRTKTNLSEESKNSQEIADETGIRKKVVTEVHDLFSQDYKENVEDLLWTRRVLRKISNISEISANALTYIGMGTTALAAGTHLIKADYFSNVLLFTGTLCFAVHLTCIGFAKCSAREEAEREKQLNSLATKVKFDVVPVIPTIEEDVND